MILIYAIIDVNIFRCENKGVKSPLIKAFAYLLSPTHHLSKTSLVRKFQLSAVFKYEILLDKPEREIVFLVPAKASDGGHHS